jgi:phospholipase/carboxylesterase
VLKLPALLALALLVTGGCNGCARSEGARLVAAARHDEAAGIRFIEVLTGGASTTETLPLVVVLHGRGGRPETIVQRTGLTSLPVRARLIAPYGLDPHGDGFTWFPGGTDEAALGEHVRRVSDRLAAMIDEIVRLRPTAGKPIVTGFSQGGMLSFSLAVLHPEAVRAAFPVSGVLLRPLWPSAWPAGTDKPRIHAFHGTADDMLLIDWARPGVKRLAEIGLPVELTEYPGEGHTISSDTRRDLAQAITQELGPAVKPQ